MIDRKKDNERMYRDKMGMEYFDIEDDALMPNERNNRVQNNTKRGKKKKKKKNTPLIVVLILMIITLLGVVAYLLLFAGNSKIAGSYTQKIDMSTEVIAIMEEYLDDAALGDDIDLTPYIDNIPITITVTFSETGSYEVTVSEEDYKMAQNKAKEALSSAMSELIYKRLDAAEVRTNKDVDTLVSEASGLNMSDYLKQYGPKLLPDITELASRYGDSGSYSIAKGSIVLTSGAGEVQEYKYIVNDSILVLSDDSHDYVYTRKENE